MKHTLFRGVLISGLTGIALLSRCVTTPEDPASTDDPDNTPWNMTILSAPNFFTTNSDIRNITSYTFYDSLNLYAEPTVQPIDLAGNLAFEERFPFVGSAQAKRRILKLENGRLKVVSLPFIWDPISPNLKYYPECYTIESDNSTKYLEKYDSQGTLGAIARATPLYFQNNVRDVFNYFSDEPAVTKDSNGKIKAFWWSQKWFVYAPEGCLGYEVTECRPFIAGSSADTLSKGVLFIPDSVMGFYNGGVTFDLTGITYFQSLGFYPQEGGNPWVLALGNRYDQVNDKPELSYYEATPGVPFTSISPYTIPFEDTSYVKKRLTTRYRIPFPVNLNPDVSWVRVYDKPAYQYFLVSSNTERNLSLYSVSKKELLEGSATLHTVFENLDPLPPHDELLAGSTVIFTKSLSDDGTLYTIASYSDGLEVTSLSSAGRKVLIPSSKKFTTANPTHWTKIYTWHDKVYLVCYTTGYQLKRKTDLVRLFGIAELLAR